jgi:hypothetical protein
MFEAYLAMWTYDRDGESVSRKFEEVMAIDGILSSRDFYPIFLSAIRNRMEFSLLCSSLSGV